jgi:hypothetical protein
MPIGENVGLGDKLIKKTTGKTINTNKANKTNKTSNVNNTNITSKTGRPSTNPKTDTYKTRKITFYAKEDLLEKLHNFAYWNRHSVTEAFNLVLSDGLKGKNVKPRE